GEAAAGAHKDLEPVDREPAEVGVVTAEDLGLVVVLVGLHVLGHDGVPAVGPYDHAGTLVNNLATLVTTTNAGHAAVIRRQLLDGEPLTDLGTPFRSGVHQKLVQDGAPRGVTDGR